mgnify:CR=1
MESSIVLKEKVDFHKTWFTASIGLIIASTLGSWIASDTLAKSSLLVITLLFTCAFFIFFSFYAMRYRELIDALRDE